ncbi:bifunctional phosphoglucose/phosphomannose isomerase [bacterium SCSIO 12643]|nr:bifunctional phosphoglucose/phosphomannose isomerase [bacterium SCSIO 12643]
MKTLIQNFTKQLNEALEIGQNTVLTPSNKTFHNVLITGMGGSGIGGTIISELAATQIPVFINNSYELPTWVNENTLVIGSTYSGNTEETISVIHKAIKSNTEIAFITSGGIAKEIIDQNNLNCILIEGGNPPRSMIAFSLVSLMFLLNHYGITQFDIESEIRKSISLIDLEEGNIISKSQSLAKNLQNTIPVIYSVSGYDGIATRFRQQINENSKMLCWHHIIPEMNHNELVGWAGGDNKFSVVFLRNSDDSSKNQHRIEINKEIISKHTDSIFEIWGKGDSKICRTLYHIHFEDWVSFHLSELNDVDVVEVKVIDYLKSELAKSHE